MTTRKIIYRGREYQVPCRTRNDAYCKARDRGQTHEQACEQNGQKNWMVAASLGELSAK